MIRALPTRVRARAPRSAPRARWSAPPIRARARSSGCRRGTASIDLRGSLFCEVREASVLPLCGFYASAIARVLQLFALPADARSTSAGPPASARAACCRSWPSVRNRGSGGRRVMINERTTGSTVSIARVSVAVAAALTLLAPAPAAAQPFQQPDPGRAVRESSASRVCTGWRSVGGAARRRAQSARPRGDQARRARARIRAAAPAAVASLSRATVIKVGQLVGAAEVIVGTLALDGGDLKVDAHSIRIDVGRLQPEVRARAADRSVRDVRPARRTFGAGLRVTAPAGSRPPLDAFENYIKGLLAESPAVQATFLETALKLSALRSRRARAVGGPDRSGGLRGGAGRRSRRAGRLPAGAPGAFSRRRLAPRSEAQRRSVRRVQGTGRRRPNQRPGGRSPALVRR